VAKDLAAITQVAGISNVLVVHPDVPAMTLRDLIALAKDKPDTSTTLPQAPVPRRT
jgi:tripartite-type tricarboxylate transporter receptor subunit TctC